MNFAEHFIKLGGKHSFCSQEFYSLSRRDKQAKGEMGYTGQKRLFEGYIDQGCSITSFLIV